MARSHELLELSNKDVVVRADRLVLMMKIASLSGFFDGFNIGS